MRRTLWGFRSLRLPSLRQLARIELLVLLAAAGCSTEQPPPTTQPPISTPTSERPASPPTATTEDIGAVALDIATRDGRLEDVLSEHDYVFEGVRPVSGTLVDVFVRFQQPVPIAEWPSAVCSIEQSREPFTGIHWRVDLNAETVAAVSPRWGEVSCIAA